MASGLAVISTKVGAVPTMVSDKNGWLINPGDKRELQGAIEEAISTLAPALDAKKIKSLDLAKENFTWDKVVKNTLDQIS
jgi:glycosyltransferase involved in cell wall biosynthesis